MRVRLNILSSGDRIQTSLTHGSVMSAQWKVCCSKVPKEEVVFISQVVTALIVIISGLLNITLTQENSSLWATLVSGAVGYLLPGPRLNKRSENKENESFLHDAPLEFVDGLPPEQHGSEVHDSTESADRSDGRLGSGLVRNCFSSTFRKRKQRRSLDEVE